MTPPIEIMALKKKMQKILDINKVNEDIVSTNCCRKCLMKVFDGQNVMVEVPQTPHL